MSSSFHNLPVIATIALLYPVFFHRLANQMSDYNKVRDLCSDNTTMRKNPFDGLMNNKENGCWEERERLLRKTEVKKHYLLLFFGLLGVFGSMSMLPPGSTRTGLGWGGVFTILVSIMFHWHIYNEQQKLLVSGICLFVAVYFSSYYFNGNQSSNQYSDTFYAVS